VYCEVPLKSMCSMKCALPASEYFSYLEPAPTQMPREAERTASICSQTILAPLGSVILSYITAPLNVL
jgi:hypothetical protein